MYKESNVSVKYRELLALAQGIQIMEGQAYEKKDGVSVKIYHKLSKNRQSILMTIDLLLLINTEEKTKKENLLLVKRWLNSQKLIRKSLMMNLIS